MAEKLQEYYNQLLDIRKYLIKIGPQRREGAISSKKYEEANLILLSFNTELSDIQTKIKIFSQSELSVINKFTDQIRKLSVEIKNLCNLPVMTDKMESFSLKTAVALLPVMDDKENVTKQLISAIELYSSLLDDKSQSILIQFILKTRLSQNAKLRLAQNYSSVKLLVDDMNKYLISKKSFTALQERLMRCTQNQRDIEDYGKQIENLFVDLTISQADGDPQKYDVIKPLNEKMAIKRFATGLRNSNLSTIISARNYESLKDAIRGAVDEQTSIRPEDSIMKLTNRQLTPKKTSYSSQGRCFQGRGVYNNQRGQFSSRSRGHPSRGHVRGGYYRGNHTPRGTYVNSNYRANRRQNYVNVVSNADTSSSSTTVEPNFQFFREQPE